jgi:hypothetical protein
MASTPSGAPRSKRARIITHRTSILQLAFAQQLLIFDMHWIYSGRITAAHASNASNADALPVGSSPSNVQAEALNLLRRLLSSPCYLKLGFGFWGDFPPPVISFVLGPAVINTHT